MYFFKKQFKPPKKVARHSGIGAHFVPRKKEKNMSKAVLLVIEAINKIGCAIEEFFACTAFAVRVPDWFRPYKEAERLKRVREDGLRQHPEYRPPECVKAFAEMVHRTQNPSKFFDDIWARTVVPPRPAVNILI